MPAFSALTLMVEQQENIQPVETNVVILVVVI